MRYIFIDLGAYDGDSIDEFLNIGKEEPKQGFLKNISLPKNPNEFIIYAFEPNPLFENKLKNKKDVIFSNKVALTHNGTVSFAVDQTDNPMGSTAEQSKTSIYDTMPKVVLPCFDFSTWIKQFEKDYVIVKMDIEGSEFPVLYKMLKDNTHKIMNQLWVEMHPNKARNYTTTDSLNLIDTLRRDIYVEYWH